MFTLTPEQHTAFEKRTAANSEKAKPIIDRHMLAMVDELQRELGALAHAQVMIVPVDKEHNVPAGVIASNTFANDLGCLQYIISAFGQYVNMLQQEATFQAMREQPRAPSQKLN